MTLRFSTVYADAGAMWRANREVLLAVVGLFFLVPVFAFNLFVALPDLKDITDQAVLYRTLADWYAANALPLVVSLAVQAFGGAVVLRLLLDGDRPTVAQAMGAVARLIPALAVATIGSAVLIGGGFMLFFFPAMYAYGRCYLVIPVVVAEPEHGVAGGFVEGLKRSHGMGWRLFTLGMTVVLPFFLFAQFAGGALGGLDPASPVALILSASFAGLLNAVMALAQLLLQAAAYRAIKQGI